MTGDELRSRYEFLKQLTTEGVRTHLALAPGGAIVLVHLLDHCSPAERERLLTRITRLDEAQRAELVDVLEVDDTPVIVTAHSPGFSTLAHWLGAPPPESVSSGAPSTALPSADAPPPATEPGEFTRLFEMPQAPEPAQEPIAEPPPDEPPAGSDVPGAAPAGRRHIGVPGEFTRLFEMPQEPAAPTATGPEPPAEAAPQGSTGVPPSTTEPGEFTRLFEMPDTPDPQRQEGGAETQPREPAAESAESAESTERPRAKEGPGEFTRLFEAANAPEAAPDRPAPAIPPTSAQAWPAPKLPPALRPRPEETPPRVAAPPPAPPQRTDRPEASPFGGRRTTRESIGTEDTYLKRLYGSGESVPDSGEPFTGPHGAGAPPPAPAPIEVPGPSEYTRVLSAPPPPPRVEARTPPPRKPAPPRGISRRAFLIGVGVVLGTALALILYFALFAGGARGEPEPVDDVQEVGAYFPPWPPDHRLSGGRWITSSM
jgi:hypothetical protein